jgi:bacterioferritin-associated ferredoxin
MIVCQCRAVSDRTIGSVIAAGASTVAAVSSATGAGTGCGGCVPAIEVLLAEAALAVTDPEQLVASQRRRVAAVGSLWAPLTVQPEGA